MIQNLIKFIFKDNIFSSITSFQSMNQIGFKIFSHQLMNDAHVII